MRSRLGQQLPDEPAASSAERESQSELLLPIQRARQKKPGEIGAGDGQDQGADDDQDPKRRLERAAKARRGADRRRAHFGADVEIQGLAPIFRKPRQRGFSRLTEDRR